MTLHRDGEGGGNCRTIDFDLNFNLECNITT